LSAVNVREVLPVLLRPRTTISLVDGSLTNLANELSSLSKSNKSSLRLLGFGSKSITSAPEITSTAETIKTNADSTRYKTYCDLGNAYRESITFINDGES